MKQINNNADFSVFHFVNYLQYNKKKLFEKKLRLLLFTMLFCVCLCFVLYMRILFNLIFSIWNFRFLFVNREKKKMPKNILFSFYVWNAVQTKRSLLCKRRKWEKKIDNLVGWYERVYRCISYFSEFLSMLKLEWNFPFQLFLWI